MINTATGREGHSVNLEDLDTTVAYRIDTFPGVAWRYLGPAMADDADTVWTGDQVPTGMARMVMVGDDRVVAIDPQDVSVLSEEWCGSCGQTGCTADTRGGTK
jgi:hypothetical protein